jgi:hypothetical protein
MSKTKFQIEVVNLFDTEKRKIKVKHNKEDGTAVDSEIDFPNDGVKHKPPFELASGDYLEVDLDKLGEEGNDATWWYIKLPFVADFRFLTKNEQTVPLIYEVVRDEKTGGRIEVRMPTHIDPTACKLRIAPPGRLEEICPTENSKGEYLSDGEGTAHDNLTLGDNGPG